MAATCCSLSPKSNPKSVCSLRLFAGSFFSSSSPNCSSPKASASVYADYLRSHFSFSRAKALRCRSRGNLSELRPAMCPSSFCSIKLFAAATNLSSSTATGPDKVAYPMKKRLPRSGMDLFLHICNLSWSLHSFSFLWKASSIIPIHKMEKPLDSPASFRPISLLSCVSMNASFYHVYSSFWSITPFSLPGRPVSALDGVLYSRSNSLSFFIHFRWV